MAAQPLPVNVPRPDEPSPARSSAPRRSCDAARNPIVLAGHGAARAGAGAALRRFAETLGIPVATTFHGKGVFPDDHPQALGAVGFMRHDYVNFGFDQADVIVAVGYELQEFDPVRINPHGDKKIIHIHRFPAEVDAHYTCRRAAVRHRPQPRRPGRRRSSRAVRAECRAASGSAACSPTSSSAAAATTASRWHRPGSSPTPGRRCGRDDIVLVDTGALKMWMARLYPTYAPNTCLISNGLSTMAWTVPGRDRREDRPPRGQGARRHRRRRLPDELAGDRDRAPRADRHGHPDLGRRRLRPDQLEDGSRDRATTWTPRSATRTSSPTPRASARAGYRITAADELLPTLRTALAADTVSVIACPVDYSANLELSARSASSTSRCPEWPTAGAAVGAVRAGRGPRDQRAEGRPGLADRRGGLARARPAGHPGGRERGHPGRRPVVGAGPGRGHTGPGHSRGGAVPGGGGVHHRAVGQHRPRGWPGPAVGSCLMWMNGSVFEMTAADHASWVFAATRASPISR